MDMIASDLKSALDGEGVTLTMDSTSNKMNPLKTTKQRNTSNNHRKSQQRSNISGGNNSTDDEDRVSPKVEMSSGAGALIADADEEGFRKFDGDNDNENTTNNDEQSGFVDSENENITDKLYCLAKLSLHGGPNVSTSSGLEHARKQLSEDGCDNSGGGCGSIPSSQLGGVKVRSFSCPSVAESDSLNEIASTSSQHHFHPIPSSSGCPGATTGDGAGEAMDDSTSRRYRRRRRRRGHNANTKRMAVETSIGKEIKGYKIRPAECPGPSSGVSCTKKPKDMDSLDSFGMKRKRTIIMGQTSSDINSNTSFLDEEIDMADMGSLSLNSPERIIDEEMKSDDEEYSSFDSEDEKGDADDRGREADDEQSDWVFDEWSNSSKKSQEEATSSRKKRLMKMLRSYNNMISANASGNGPLSSSANIETREIRAGKRRVHLSKSEFPPKTIWTSANEEVSKFLQDPLQSQIRLQPISAEEGVQLGHLASLYSLRMDCDTTENRKREELQNYQDIDVTDPSGVLFPVLTKTPNTTQMDKLNDPSASSPFNAEGSSSSNVSGVSSVYTYSDIDSKTGDSKRIKK